VLSTGICPHPSVLFPDAIQFLVIDENAFFGSQINAQFLGAHRLDVIVRVFPIPVFINRFEDVEELIIGYKPSRFFPKIDSYNLTVPFPGTSTGLFLLSVRGSVLAGVIGPFV